MRDIPETSSLKFDFVMPDEPYEKQNEWLTKWDNNGIRTFVLLQPTADVNVVNAKILNMVRQHDKKVTTITTFLFPYQNTYLYSKFTNGQPDGGRIEYVRLFTIVAIFLLIIACINFMNLGHGPFSQTREGSGYSESGWGPNDRTSLANSLVKPS